MRGEKQNTVDLTGGVIWKQLFLFALPLLGSSLVQQLYNTVDLLFVGNFVGKNASAAVGSSGTLVACVVGFFTGLSVGAGVVTAQSIGAGDEERTAQTIHTAVFLGLAGGMMLSVLGVILAPTLLSLMRVPEEIFGDAVRYLRLYLAGLCAIVTYNMCAGIIRAMGNSRIPMMIQLIGGIINVAVDGIFIGCLGWGVRGAAAATLFSQTGAAALSFLYLLRAEEPCRLHLRKIRPDAKSAKHILTIGIPAGLQSLVIEFSNVLIQYQINGFDVDAIAAFAVYFQAEFPVYYPIAAFGQAATTFSGQNTGAGNRERVRQGAKVCILMGIGLTICTGGLLSLFAPRVIWLFNKEAAVIGYGTLVIRYSFPFYWIYVIHEVLACTIRGSGKSFPPMFIILMGLCIFRTLLLFWIVRTFHDIRGVAAVYPISWAVTSLAMVLYYRFGHWEPERGSR